MFRHPTPLGRYLSEGIKKASLFREVSDTVQRVPEDKRSFVEEVRVLLVEEEDHRRREEDLRSSEQVLHTSEKPLTEKAKELAETVR